MRRLNKIDYRVDSGDGFEWASLGNVHASNDWSVPLFRLFEAIDPKHDSDLTFLPEYPNFVCYVRRGTGYVRIPRTPETSSDEPLAHFSPGEYEALAQGFYRWANLPDQRQRWQHYDFTIEFRLTYECDGEIVVAIVSTRVAILPSASFSIVHIRITQPFSSLFKNVKDDETYLERIAIVRPAFDQIVSFLTENTDGLLLVSGPMGCGKTTTAYAILDVIKNNVNRPGRLGQLMVASLEDPIEMQNSGMLQISLNPQRGFDFARGFRSVLRHNPDVVMFGEIRDPESARTSIEAACTGHLIVTTIHSGKASRALMRLRSLGAPIEVLSQVPLLIINQHFAPRICGMCSSELTSYKGIDWLDTIDIKINEICPRLARPNFGSGVKCDQCGGSGYFGKVAVLSLLSGNATLLAKVDGGHGEVVGVSGSPNDWTHLRYARHLFARGFVDEAELARFDDDL